MDPPVERFHRSTDLATSIAAAIRASKASSKAVIAVKNVMRDGVERIDEDIWLACREAGYLSSLETVQHGRLSLSEAGIVINTGLTKLTKRGKCKSTIWRWAADSDTDLQIDALLSNKEWKKYIAQPPVEVINIDMAIVWEERARALAHAVNDLLQYHPVDDEEEWFESFESNLTPAMVAVLGPSEAATQNQMSNHDPIHPEAPRLPPLRP